ncbi:MAG: type II toxin-antitoxin system PemK/MazF family toxin [Gillisia sp.]
MELIQYTVILVNLEPTVGSEINKTRPCVIISPNEMNKHLRTVIVAPLTTNLKKYPSRILINTNGKKAMIIIDQIRTVDKTRIIKIFDKLTKPEIRKFKEVMKETFID